MDTHALAPLLAALPPEALAALRRRGPGWGFDESGRRLKHAFNRPTHGDHLWLPVDPFAILDAAGEVLGRGVQARGLEDKGGARGWQAYLRAEDNSAFTAYGSFGPHGAALELLEDVCRVVAGVLRVDPGTSLLTTRDSSWPSAVYIRPFEPDTFDITLPGRSS